MEGEAAPAIDKQLADRVAECIRKGDNDGLAAALEEHVRRHPSSAPLLLQLIAGLLAQNGQFADAIPLYIQALKAEPTNPQIYFHLGLAYHGLNRRPECHQVWDELPSRFPNHALADYQAALRLIDENRTQEAQLLLAQALDKVDKTSSIHMQILSSIRAMQD